MPSRQAANPVPFTLFSSKSHSCPLELLEFPFPQLPPAPKTAAKNNFRPFQQSRGRAHGLGKALEKGKEEERRGKSSFRLQTRTRSTEDRSSGCGRSHPHPHCCSCREERESQECCWEQRVGSLASPAPPGTDRGITKGKKKGSVTRPKCGTGCE